MTSLAPEDHLVTEVDSPRWCWSELRAASEGILWFTASGRRLSLAVPFTTEGQQLVIALAPINTTGWRAAGCRVTLDVVGTDPDGLRWLVRASGHAHRTPRTPRDPTLLASPLDRPCPAAEEPADLLTMPLVYVRGFHERAGSDRRFPQPAHPGPTRPGRAPAPVKEVEDA